MKKNTSNNSFWFRRKIVLIPISIILILVTFRIALPSVLKHYTNKALHNIPGYYGEVSTIKVGLFSGKYIIENLYINKINAKTQIPFLSFPKSIVALDVNEILRGNIVSDIYLANPEIIYILSDHNQTSNAPEPELDDWSKALTEIVPIAINELKVEGGKFGYVEINTKPNIDLHIQNISLIASNLRNTKSINQGLPSSVVATGNTVGGGELQVEGKMDLIQQIPDVDIALTIRNANATALNDFTKHYTGIDFARGTFEMYGELKIDEGYVNGLVNPAFINSKFIGKGDKFLSVLWEGFVGMFKFLIKNHKNNSISMKVPFKGDLNKIKTNKMSAFFSLFQNAWIKAFHPVGSKEEGQSSKKNKDEDT
ncbi:DUF748 domain-containing protein [Croceitalea rosinachiae]|uniref:DUF748 domain-containing protein n=1 Tax=Croceitalea rosinachiae TaxID=3075596 RepID=A0ABU3A723_9FLAO|nr:DUF748 domain-containing protein [Croceitalea sp. F388]MDT0605967.1 DUF748 domain-containing protein [Croceitalea sp. F388]